MFEMGDAWRTTEAIEAEFSREEDDDKDKQTTNANDNEKSQLDQVLDERDNAGEVSSLGKALGRERGDGDTVVTEKRKEDSPELPVPKSIGFEQGTKQAVAMDDYSLANTSAARTTESIRLNYRETQIDNEELKKENQVLEQQRQEYLAKSLAQEDELIDLKRRLQQMETMMMEKLGITPNPTPKETAPANTELTDTEADGAGGKD